VTQANIDELDEALQTFQAAKAKPRTTVVERSVQTESLSGLIREASNILRDQIDRLVNLLRRSNPEFVAGYRSARVIVGLQAVPRSPRRRVRPRHKSKVQSPRSKVTNER
jgi:hypothetical protein